MFPIRGKLWSFLDGAATDEMRQKGGLSGVKEVDSDGNSLLKQGRQAVFAPGERKPKGVYWNLFRALNIHASRVRCKARVEALGVKPTGTFKR